ncbi:MAG: hypothetical protein IGS48_10550 [Oscillatoriales cyanobacterium C42_A2020_001]|nr:hypothetical protein [Leptolyngbyaceae cyanobacterium C42_A2020_001]
MKWVAFQAIAVPLLSASFAAALANVSLAATPAPGDVVVEIKLESSGVVPLNPPRDRPTPASPQTAFPSFNSQQLDRQLQQYMAYLERVGTPDILIVGSSRALQGVDPLALQQGLAQQGYSGLKIYNFGINGATAQVVDWLLHNLLPPEHLPKLIIWADGSRAFNSGRIDQTFNKIVTSRGHRLLTSGIRPTPAVSAGLNVGRVCMDLLPVQLPMPQSAQTELYARNATVEADAKARSLNPDCKQPLKLVVRHSQPSAPFSPGSTNSPESLGFQTVNTRFIPDRYFQRYPRVSGAFDADYRDFGLVGNQAEAFEKVVRFVNARRVSLVLVNLPLTSTYLDSTRTFHEERFRRRMQNASRSKRFIFADLAIHQHLSQNQYFADPSHLNRYGATAVSLQLSKELAGTLSTALPRKALIPSIQQFSTENWRCNSACLYLPRMFSG